MKLEYLADLSGGGRYPNAYPPRLLRLYDFDAAQTAALTALIETRLLGAGQALPLDEVPFIDALNCQLTLELAAEDAGVAETGPGRFACRLTPAAYRQVVACMHSVDDGHQWLDNMAAVESIDWLYSSGGTW